MPNSTNKIASTVVDSTTTSTPIITSSGTKTIDMGNLDRIHMAQTILTITINTIDLLVKLVVPLTIITIQNVKNKNLYILLIDLYKNEK